jgi:hypothetical protein
MAKWKAIQAAGEAVGLGPTRLRAIECKQALYHRITRRSDRAGDYFFEDGVLFITWPLTRGPELEASVCDVLVCRSTLPKPWKSPTG